MQDLAIKKDVFLQDPANSCRILQDIKHFPKTFSGIILQDLAG